MTASTLVTPATTMADEPTTFFYDDRTYQPSNFGDRFYGTVTVRQAMAKSLNIPTVKLAEMAGFRSVLDLAKRAGMSMNVGATPAISLGAADATPIEVAGAYTMFDNRGVVSKPNWIRMIRSHKGLPDLRVPTAAQGRSRPPGQLPDGQLDAGGHAQRNCRRSSRSRGFTLPAAGKTGTSRDGWFAGFTSKLICVVWVGFDDGKDLNLEGAKSALPIWTEFMKRAHTRREYRNVRDWDAPDGIVSVDIDPLSGQLATGACPGIRPEFFVSGTQPVEMCRLHGGGGTQVAGWETTPAPSVTPEPETPQRRKPLSATREDSIATAQAPPRQRRWKPRKRPAPATPAEKPKEKKGFFGKIKDIFK